MHAVRFLRFVSFAAACLVGAFDAAFAVDARRPISLQPVQEIDFRRPDEVKPLLTELMKPPSRPPRDERVLYARGVGHFDDFLPGAAQLEKEQPEKSYHRLTFHDGRVTLCECFDDTGALAGHQIIRYDRRGAPRATGSFNAEGKANWYKYAAYDQAGRISSICTFDDLFELRFFEEFNYRGEAVDIRRRDRELELQFETIYENGGVFLVIDGVKRKVNTVDRKDAIRAPIKLGLKPYYPGYEAPAEAEDAAK